MDERKIKDMAGDIQRQLVTKYQGVIDAPTIVARQFPHEFAAALLAEWQLAVMPAVADSVRLDWFAKHGVHKATLRKDDYRSSVVNAWAITSTGADLREAIDTVMQQQSINQPEKG
jgi:hypothetical protein